MLCVSSTLSLIFLYGLLRRSETESETESQLGKFFFLFVHDTVSKLLSFRLFCFYYFCFKKERKRCWLTGNVGVDGSWMCGCYCDRVREPLWRTAHDLASCLQTSPKVLQQNDCWSLAFLLGFLCLLSLDSHLCSSTHDSLLSLKDSSQTNSESEFFKLKLVCAPIR